MMKYCNECKVHVSTKTQVCPLCKTPFEVTNVDEEYDTYPPYKQKSGNAHFLTRVFAYLSIIGCGICVVINLLSSTETLWCIIAGASILYGWLLIQFTFMTKINLGLKLLTHAIALPCLIVIINLFSNNVIEVSWALTYAIPFILGAFAITITITVLVTRMRWRDYTLYMFSIAILGFIPLIIICCLGFAQPIWPSIVSAGIAFSALLSMFMFMDKRTKNELRKRFHL